MISEADGTLIKDLFVTTKNMQVIVAEYHSLRSEVHMYLLVLGGRWLIWEFKLLDVFLKRELG